LTIMAMAPKMQKSASEASFGVNSKLSESRREKLINLKKREDLKDALTARFKSRFGHGAPERGADEVSVCSSTIKREVNAFAGRAAVTEANLERLERRLQKRATNTKDADAVSLSGVSAYSGASVRSRSLASLAGESVVKGGMPDAYDWGRLDEYASYLHEQDSLRQMQGVRALQRKMKADLDQQVSEKGGKDAFEKEEDRRYHQAQMVELERWKEREQSKAEEMKQKVMREKVDRDEQLAFEQKLKNEEVNKKKDEEAKLVSKIVYEMEQDHKKFEKKKEETRKAMKKVFEQNMKDQKVREGQKKSSRRKMPRRWQTTFASWTSRKRRGHQSWRRAWVSKRRSWTTCRQNWVRWRRPWVTMMQCVRKHRKMRWTGSLTRLRRPSKRN